MRWCRWAKADRRGREMQYPILGYSPEVPRLNEAQPRWLLGSTISSLQALFRTTTRRARESAFDSSRGGSSLAAPSELCLKERIRRAPSGRHRASRVRGVVWRAGDLLPGVGRNTLSQHVVGRSLGQSSWGGGAGGDPAVWGPIRPCLPVPASCRRPGPSGAHSNRPEYTPHLWAANSVVKDDGSRRNRTTCFCPAGFLSRVKTAAHSSALAAGTVSPGPTPFCGWSAPPVWCDA